MAIPPKRGAVPLKPSPASNESIPDLINPRAQFPARYPQQDEKDKDSGDDQPWSIWFNLCCLRWVHNLPCVISNRSYSFDESVSSSATFSPSFFPSSGSGSDFIACFRS